MRGVLVKRGKMFRAAGMPEDRVPGFLHPQTPVKVFDGHKSVTMTAAELERDLNIPVDGHSHWLREHVLPAMWELGDIVTGR